MDLRRKVLLGFVVILAATMCILAALPVFVILDDYKKLESTYVRTDVNLVLKNLDAEIRSLEANAPDWGAWDDTYLFARGEKPDYVDSNLMPATFETLRASFIIITDEEGTVLYGNGFDLVNGTAEPPDPALIAELRQNEILSRTLSGTTGVSGFLSLPDGPVIFSSYPILQSNYTGPPEGMVVIGRNVADTGILGMAGGTAPAISILPFDPSLFQPADQALLTGNGDASILVLPVNGDVVEGHTVIRDVFGRDALLLTLAVPRGIYRQGNETILIFTLLQLVIILGAGAIAIIALDRGVFSRITAIDADIAAITKRTGGITRIRASGSNELSRLAGAMNALLDQIEKNQADLQESEEKFRSIVETSPNLIWELDAKGRVVYISPTITTTVGYTPEEITGQLVTSLISEEERAASSKKLAQALAPGNGQGIFEIAARHRDGRTVILDIRPVRLTDPAGKLKGLRGVAIDITERKRTENALRQVIKKFTILSSITRHDILNKLSVLRGFLTMVKRNVTDEKLLGYIAGEESAAAAIEHQISFTRDYENIGINAPRWMDVRATISLALSHLDPLPVPVTIDIDDLYIYADPLLEKVFYNLVENAIRHGEKITRISFFCQKFSDGLSIICEDDGKGVPDSEKENIFIRKYFQHTGLGLFLSREILNITGIGIQECGEEGAGARFEIFIPGTAFRFGEKPREPARGGNE